MNNKQIAQDFLDKTYGEGISLGEEYTYNDTTSYIYIDTALYDDRPGIVVVENEVARRATFGDVDKAIEAGILPEKDEEDEDIIDEELRELIEQQERYL